MIHSPDMSSDKKPEKLEELRSNVRHITQLGMNWFAFFVTVNYLTMGWLAKDFDKKSIDRYVILSVTIVFIVQDFLGIFGLAGVLRAATAMKLQINTLERDAQAKQLKPESIRARLSKIPDLYRSLEKSKSSIPIELYKLIGLFLMTVLISLIAAWVVICVRYLYTN